MKKYFYLLMMGMIGTCLPSQAQTENDRETLNENDSLKTVINNLNQKIETTEKEIELQEKWKRKRFFSIGYVTENLTHQEEKNLKWKSDFGISLTKGKSYFVHKRPIANVLKFAIDLSLADLTYAKLKENYVVNGLPSSRAYHAAANNDGFNEIITPEGAGSLFGNLGLHALDAGIQIGPSIWVNPIDHLMVNGYFRYNPTAAMLILDDEFNIGYGSNFVSGGAISYKKIALGFEARWGKTNYKSMDFDEEALDNSTEEDGNGSISSIFNTSRNKMKMKSTRVYLSIRF